MPSITNKTRQPLSVPLPRGKKLHLGPGQSSEVAPNALDHASVKKLAEAGDIEIIRESHASIDAAGGPKRRASGEAHTSGVSRRSGDR